MKGYIITGAPGTGKTALINKLSEEGFLGLPEIPRMLIKEKIAEKYGISPFKDLDRFFALVFNEMYKQYLSVIGKKGIIFFDRAMPDVLGYCYKYKLGFSDKFKELINKSMYERNVFFCPVCENFYTNDPERPYSFEEVKLLDKYLHEGYKDLGFTIDILPETSIKKRITYIKGKICIKN